MLYRLAKFLVKCFMYVFFRLKVHNAENLPKDGGVIVAINHRSYWDVPLCASVLKRKLFFMAKHDLFDIPVLGGIIKWAGAFPVTRASADIGAIKTALNILKLGKCMAIFPEGTRVKENGTHEAKAGVALIASKAGVPVIPVCVSGKYGFLRKIDIFVGKPVYVVGENGGKPTKEELMSYSREILNGILNIKGDDDGTESC